MMKRTNIAPERAERLRALIRQARERGIPMAQLSRACGERQSPSFYAFARGDTGLGPERAARYEAGLARLLGQDASAHAHDQGDDVAALREGLRAELDKRGGRVVDLARQLGTTAHDLSHVLGGGAFGQEIESAARELLGMKIGNGFMAPALPEGATVEERARKLFDAWGASAIALVLAKAGKKEDTGNQGG